MGCPAEVAEIIAEVLQTGLLRIRALGWSGMSARCAIEADHLHNLPALLADYEPKMLEFYWRVSRVAFIQQSSPAEAAGFEALWIALAEHVGAGQDEPLPVK